MRSGTNRRNTNRTRMKSTIRSHSACTFSALYKAFCRETPRFTRKLSIARLCAFVHRVCSFRAAFTRNRKEKKNLSLVLIRVCTGCRGIGDHHFRSRTGWLATRRSVTLGVFEEVSSNPTARSERDVALSLPRARIVGREGSRANPENAKGGSSAARRGRHWRECGVYLARYTPRKEYHAHDAGPRLLEMPSVPAELRAVSSIWLSAWNRGFATENTLRARVIWRRPRSRSLG